MDERITEYLKEGMLAAEIAKLLKCDIGAVWNVIYSLSDLCYSLDYGAEFRG